MTDEDKTREDLLNELKELRQRFSDLEAAQAQRAPRQALKQSEEKFRLLYEEAPLGYQALDESGRLLEVNKAWLDLLGYSREEVIGRSFGDFLAPGSRDHFKDHFPRCRAAGGSHGMEVDLVRKDGTIISAIFDGEAVRDEKGQFRQLHCLMQNITEKKRAEEALRASEEKYRLLVDNAPVGILSVDTEGRILEVNKKVLEIMGSPSADATKAINILSFAPLVEAGISDVFLYCMTHGRVEGAEIPYKSNCGRASYLRMLLTPFVDQGGRIKGCQALVEDITERKEIEEALRENQRVLERIFAAVPVGINLARNREIQWANESWVRMFGFQDEHQYIGQSARILYPSDEEYRRAGEALYENLETGAVREIDTRFRRRDGSIFDGIIRITALDPVDVTKGVIATITDVSRRKRAEDALRQSEEKYRAIFNNAAVGIDLLDRHGRFMEVNDTLLDFLGYTSEELRKLTIFAVTHPADLEKSKKVYDALVSGDSQSYRLEKRYLRKDGAVVWSDTSLSAIRGQDGEYQAGVGVIVDISDRKKSEEAGVRLATAIEQAAEAILIADSDGTITYVNPAFQRITGYSREESIGANPRFLRSGKHDTGFYRAMWETISSGTVWRGHFVNRKKDGTLFEEEATISPIKDESGRIVNYVAVKRDVTREVSLQKQLLQAQKMEAIGTLAGGIAHDFNNLLQVTLGYSELLLGEKGERDSEYGDLRKIFQAAKGGAELVQRLLTFSRKVEPKPIPMNLNRQIVQVEKLLRRTIPKMVDIRLHLSADVAKVSADPTQMEQVLMNLAVNAR